MAKQVKKQKKELLDWLVPLICIVVVVGVLVGLLINPIKDGIDYNRSRNITLIESEDGSVAVKRPVAQAITWLQLYESFRQSYSNYSLYKYYTNMFGDSINLSSLISDEEVDWVESNISAMQSQLGLVFYTYADVDDETITSDDVSASTMLFALYLAGGTETYLGTYLGNYLHTIEHYVAIAGAANAAGVTLDEEDLKSVDESMESFKALPESLSYKGSFKKFIKDFMGDSIKESDVRTAYELMTLVSKYSIMVSDQYYDGITDAERVAYRDENKGEFYTATYLHYSTDIESVAKELEAAKTKADFQQIVAKSVLTTQYVTEIAKLEQSVLTKGEPLEDDLATALNSAGFSALTTYNTAAEGADVALKAAFFDGEEKSSRSLYLVEADDGVYLVWYKEASAESVSVRTKFYSYDGLTAYDGISTFRADVYQVVLDSLEADSIQYNVSHDSSAFLEVSENCLNAVKNVLPTSLSASYKDDATVGSFEEWISDLSLEAGDAVCIEPAGDESTYDVYLLLTPMVLDEEASVNGGYLKYDTESAANDGKKALEGKTGTTLVNALQNLNSDAAITSSRLVEGDFDMSEDVKGWFFADDRKDGDTAIIAVTTEVENDETTSEDEEASEPTVTTKTEYYLVAFRSAMSIWESKATEGAANDKTTAWVEELEKTLKINEKELTRLGVDLTEDEED